MRTKNHAVIFDRVSSRDQRDGFSLDAQRTLSEKYAAEKELKVIRHWSVDESASKEDDRKHFFEMIEYIKANGIKNIIFDKSTIPYSHINPLQLLVNHPACTQV